MPIVLDMTAQTMFRSRAVTRTVEAGNSAICAGCGVQVKFKARVRLTQVIANVYIDGVWDRVEHFHSQCYEVAQEPYGSAG